MFRFTASVLLFCFLSLGPNLARAEPPPSDGKTTERTAPADGNEEISSLDESSGEGASPTASWREGVSREDAEQARRLFAEGNALVKESVFVPAIEKYEQALEHWDHPSIHYNLSLALLNLEQPLRLREHLVLALKYEGKPLSEEKIRRARQYLNLVEKQLSHVVINCKHRGATVKVDDREVIQAPGVHDEYYLPGRYQVVASASGYVQSKRDLNVVPGETTSMDLRLYTEEEWTRYKRMWSPIGPILATASGVVVAGGGGLMFWLGGNQVHSEDDRLNELCGTTGCDGDETKRKKTGQVLQRVGIVTMATGGVAAIVGGILMYVNRKIPYREDPEANKLKLSPVVGPEFSGLLGRGTF